ncbi:uncharacterized protein LOC124301361 [Neodiprion virginianus]|uniref:uncharacterized protein LOC124301361 n=1 Tax=Neodiprion virginianus TaxID=2961670 RepID=UPI001EE741E6|nr:uncharacterized protein LOC124301361 [Neodiprion virginianus]
MKLGNTEEGIAESKVQVKNINENIEKHALIETLDVENKSATVNANSRRYFKDSQKKKKPYTTDSAPTTGTRKRRQSEQLSSTRDQFAAIAESHVQSMMMLAEAAKLQAEGTKRHADAMGRLAEAMERQADAAVQNATNEKAKIEVMSQLVEVLS